MNRYMQRYGLDKRDIAAVAVKNKRNAADHPAALLGQADITIEDVLASEVLAWPVQRLDVSPISDGAVAIVMASEDAARRLTDKPVWVDGVGWNLDTTYWTNRDLSYPEYVENAARMAYDMAGITEPRKQIHIAEPYDPFDYKELHHLEGLLLFDKGKAPEAARDGVTARDGDLPCCPSGGLLGVGNPIAAAGLMKIAELFWQLRGEAGARQVPGTPERGVAQAWGDLMQVGTVVVMAADTKRNGGGGPSPATLPTSHPLSDAEFHGAVGAVDDTLDIAFEWDAGEAMGGFLEGLARRADRCDALRGVRADVGATEEVLRTVLPADRSLGGGRGERRGRDVLDLSRLVGHAATRPAGTPGRDPHRRREQRRVPAHARGGRPGRRADRDGGRSRVAPDRGAHGLDPGYRVLPSPRR